MDDEKKIIYLFGFSSSKEFHLENILNIIKEQIELGATIKLVLIHDGVIGISIRTKKSNYFEQLLNLPIKVYAVEPDLLARGIKSDNIDERIIPLNYEKLVDLLAESAHIVSWM